MEPVEVSNYRPVAILNVLCKIFERSVCVQLYRYLNENDILYKYQSGFREGFSTETCIIHLTDYIKEQNARGNYTGVVFLDIQKAFDSVNHNILCDKLKAMGVCNIEWFMSYLCDHKQIVSINGCKSEECYIPAGVPQRSILGTLLYLCYINDVHKSVDCKILLYADDTALIVSDKDPEVIKERLSIELKKCNRWLIENKLDSHGKN